MKVEGKNPKQLDLFEGLTPEAARLLENFEIVAGASGGVKRLQELVLGLAARGRLVAQDQRDEPATVILDKIAVERAQGGAGREHRTLQPLHEDEAPYDAPPGWCWTRWGTLTLFTESGWSPQCESRPRTGSEWGVLKVSAVSWNTFDPEENKALTAGTEPRPGWEVRRDDFLMSRANTAELVGRSVIVDRVVERLILSDKIVRCAFSTQVNPWFLNYFNRTSTAREHYRRNASGTSDSMKNISRDVILSVPVPLPPFAEQQRIVAKVDDLMKLCDDLEAALRHAEDTSRKLADALVAELLA